MNHVYIYIYVCVCVCVCVVHSSNCANIVPSRTHARTHTHTHTHSLSLSLYIYIYIYICVAIFPYRPKFLAGPQDGIQPLHSADTLKSLLVGKHLRVHMLESIEEHCFCICPYSSSNVLFVLLGWFVTWDSSGRAARVFWGASSWNSSKHNIAFFCCFHQVFSPCVQLESRWCI